MWVCRNTPVESRTGTKQTVDENDFQLCTAGRSLMLSIHHADEEFYRIEKSTQFELITVQTYSACELGEKITSNPVGQKQTKPRRQCTPVVSTTCKFVS